MSRVVTDKSCDLKLVAEIVLIIKSCVIQKLPDLKWTTEI
jgi:hypothetical protein